MLRNDGPSFKDIVISNCVCLFETPCRFSREIQSPRSLLADKTQGWGSAWEVPWNLLCGWKRSHVFSLLFHVHHMLETRHASLEALIRKGSSLKPFYMLQRYREISHHESVNSDREATCLGCFAGDWCLLSSPGVAAGKNSAALDTSHFSVSQCWSFRKSCTSQEHTFLWGDTVVYGLSGRKGNHPPVAWTLFLGVNRQGKKSNC